MARNKDKEVRCSFCGKPQSAVDRLIAGHEAFICGDCMKKMITDTTFPLSWNWMLSSFPLPWK